MAEPVSRRQLLTLLGGVAVVAGGGLTCATHRPVSFGAWRAGREAPYYIAHRGCGDVIPEHSLPGYLQALDWGAEALEISVVVSSDGVLYCNHDLTLGRTSTLEGAVNQTPASVLDGGRLRVPRLGPRWVGNAMPPIPRLADVLSAVGRRAVLCIEAKDGRAFQPMLAALQQRGLLDTVMIKAPLGSPMLTAAKAAGLPRFGYIGSATEVTEARVAALAASLEPATDAMVLPTRGSGVLLDAALVSQAVDTGVPTWVYATHRRSEVARHAALGVQGFVTPNLGYVAGRVARSDRDTFADGQLAPGLMTVDPTSEQQGVGWDIPGAVVLDTPGRSAFVTLGDLAPLPQPAGPYSVGFEACLLGQPGAPEDGVVLVIGTPDDASPAAPEARGGYVLRLGFDSRLHLSRSGDNHELASESMPPWHVGEWVRVTLVVTPTTLTCTVGGVALTSPDATWRGTFLHLGRTGGAGRVALRNVRVSR